MVDLLLRHRCQKCAPPTGRMPIQPEHSENIQWLIQAWPMLPSPMNYLQEIPDSARCAEHATMICQRQLVDVQSSLQLRWTPRQKTSSKGPSIQTSRLIFRLKYAALVTTRWMLPSRKLKKKRRHSFPTFVQQQGGQRGKEERTQ